MTTIVASLGEIESLCKKAFRGAGYSWGLAEEGAKSNSWMISKGVLSTKSLSLLLDTVSQKRMPIAKPDLSLEQWCPSNQSLCPVLTACTLIDYFTVYGFPSRVHNVLFPLQMIGVLGMFAERTKNHILVQWEHTHILLSEHGCICVSNNINIHQAPCISLSVTSEKEGYFIDNKDWHCLEKYACKTYVVASAESSHDAGAGQSDND